MAQLTFTTPKGNYCYSCLALDTHSYYCEYFKEFLHNEFGGAGCMKCNECKKLDKEQKNNKTKEELTHENLG